MTGGEQGHCSPGTSESLLFVPYEEPSMRDVGIYREPGRGYVVELRVRPYPKRRRRFPLDTPIVAMRAWREAQRAELLAQREAHRTSTHLSNQPGAVETLRKALGWSLLDLAAAAGVTVSTIMRAERTHPPALQMHNLEKIAHALDVTVGDLLAANVETPGGDRDLSPRAELVPLVERAVRALERIASALERSPYATPRV
jgi:transcriptional regulator with XRE-family HTH domain